MKKKELVKIIKEAKKEYKESLIWFAHGQDAKERMDFGYANTCKKISTEHEYKMRGMLAAIELTTGCEISLWYFGDFTEEVIADIALKK